MNDDLRQRYNAINAKAEKLSELVQTGVTSPAAAFGVPVLLTKALGLARDAMERLEPPEETAWAVETDNCDRAKLSFWQQKPLDCQGIKIGGRGKIDVAECDIPIPSGPIDIREFTCRRV